MTEQKDGVKTLEEAQPNVKFGSKEHKAMIEGGYQMSFEQAETIIKERKADPHTWPYDKYEKALAMMAALKTKPQPSSTKEPWKVDRRSRG